MLASAPRARQAAGAQPIMHLQEDAALIEELRSGYAQLAERSAKACLPLPGGAGVGGRAPAGGYASQGSKNMPILKNPRHERFAQLVASGISANAAFTQVGYKGAQNSPRLRKNE